MPVLAARPPGSKLAGPGPARVQRSESASALPVQQPRRGTPVPGQRRPDTPAAACLHRGKIETASDGAGARRTHRAGGGRIAMTNARRLGRIRLQDDHERGKLIAKLGFDPLYEMPSKRAFVPMLQKRKGVLKAVLLDQGFAAAVGNWIADEILYQAGIDPQRPASSLDDAEAGRIHAKLRDVIKKACDVDADKDRLPKSWLFHHRWGKDADATTSRGEKIEHLTIAGRTTAWVPSRQR